MTTAPPPEELLSFICFIAKTEINFLKVHFMVGYTFLYKKYKKKRFFGKNILNAIFFKYIRAV